MASACTEHYLKLMEKMENLAPRTLDHFRGGRKGWEWDTITKNRYQKLYYRVIWGAGFRAQTVFDKEAEYFKVLRRNFYPNRKFEPSGRADFLKELEGILGGRKNTWMADFLELLEGMGWASFKKKYVTPRDGLECDLQQLPGIGAVTVKLLLNQTGIVDVAKPDIWVTRFAEFHGFDDPLACARKVAEETGDEQTTVDAVLVWAGRKGHMPEVVPPR